MLIGNASILHGGELEYVQDTSLRIRDGRFQRIGSGLVRESGEDYADCEGLLAIPGFVNCHTHLGDSVAKDVYLNGTVDARIHPVLGIKPKILQRTGEEHLASFMRNSCISMMSKGITTFADFREGGMRGITLLKQALSGLAIRPVILGRLEFYQGERQVRDNEPFPENMNADLDRLVVESDGVGISGANENSNDALENYSRTPKMRAIHSAETEQSSRSSMENTGMSEPARAMLMRPDFLVHMTYASREDLKSAALHSTGIVICPRANASLAEGIPNVVLMLESGCTVALGTDNVMINGPDMFREMDYLWKVTMGVCRRRIDPKEILKMATVNGGKVLCKDIGVIGENKLADCIFLDKHALDVEPMHNPYASIVHRAGESAVRAVMIGGRIVHGRL